MRSKKRITHVDVAKHAGVSTAVVSYVINDGPRPTSPDVRERVLQAIKTLDYHPNASARGLRAQQTRTIGLVFNDFLPMNVFFSSYSASILTGLTAQLKARGYYVLIYPLDVGEDIQGLERLLRSQRVDGVVVRLAQEPPHTDTLLEAIAAASVPCVCIEQPGAERFGFSSITYDDRRGAYEATSYLIAQGHRRIGHIYGDLRYLTARLRLDGYRCALSDHGIHVNDELITGGTWTAETARAGVAHLFSSGHPPTAIFVASDDLAFIVIEEIRSRNYRIPADVSVIGFDDVELARQKDPPLTTVRIPLIELGRRAVDLVLDTIQAGSDNISTRAEVLPVELVRRASA